jgi:transcriptional regulator with XRE-family HTH domain
MQLKDTDITEEDMKAIYLRIAQNVKKIRQSKHISQLQLSLAIGHKAVGTISMCELGINNKHFNLEHLYKIADVLEVDVIDFFEDVNIH